MDVLIDNLYCFCLRVLSHLACVASVSVRFRRKERGTRVKDREKSGASGSRFISRAVKTESPLPRSFSGLSLLRNQTETLATQAISHHMYSNTMKISATRT